MGSWFSSAQSPSNTIKIVMIGNTETGKTHFLHKTCGDAEQSAPTKPTFGKDHGKLVHGGITYDFTELGFMSLNPLPDNYFDHETVQCVMWFIDNHDSIEDIFPIRSKLLSLMNARDETLPDIPLCVVHNVGRKHRRRRSCLPAASGPKWVDYDVAKGDKTSQRFIVEWNKLSRTIDMEMLKQYFSSICVTELSYTESGTPALIFDWIYKNAPTLPPSSSSSLPSPGNAELLSGK